MPCRPQRGVSTGESVTCPEWKLGGKRFTRAPKPRSGPSRRRLSGPDHRRPGGCSSRHSNQAALRDTAPDRDTSLSLPSEGPFGGSSSAALSGACGPRSPLRGSLTGKGVATAETPGDGPRATWGVDRVWSCGSASRGIWGPRDGSCHPHGDGDGQEAAGAERGTAEAPAVRHRRDLPS